MIRKLIPAALLGLALLMPGQSAQAQNPLGGAIIGGGLGAIIGGAAGGGRGAAIGAVIGATTGAVIASQGQRRGDYWYYDSGCYVQQPDGGYVVVAPRYCAVADAGPPPLPPGADWCARRYRSYDPVSGTYRRLRRLPPPLPVAWRYVRPAAGRCRSAAPGRRSISPRRMRGTRRAGRCPWDR